MGWVSWRGGDKTGRVDKMGWKGGVDTIGRGVGVDMMGKGE